MCRRQQQDLGFVHNPHNTASFYFATKELPTVGKRPSLYFLNYVPLIMATASLPEGKIFH